MVCRPSSPALAASAHAPRQLAENARWSIHARPTEPWNAGPGVKLYTTVYVPKVRSPSRHHSHRLDSRTMMCQVPTLVPTLADLPSGGCFSDGVGWSSAAADADVDAGPSYSKLASPVAKTICRHLRLSYIRFGGVRFAFGQRTPYSVAPYSIDLYPAGQARGDLKNYLCGSQKFSQSRITLRSHRCSLRKLAPAAE